MLRAPQLPEIAGPCRVGEPGTSTTGWYVRSDRPAGKVFRQPPVPRGYLQRDGTITVVDMMRSPLDYKYLSWEKGPVLTQRVDGIRLHAGAVWSGAGWAFSLALLIFLAWVPERDWQARIFLAAVGDGFFLGPLLWTSLAGWLVRIVVGCLCMVPVRALWRRQRLITAIRTGTARPLTPAAWPSGVRPSGVVPRLGRRSDSARQPEQRADGDQPVGPR